MVRWIDTHNILFLDPILISLPNIIFISLFVIFYTVMIYGCLSLLLTDTGANKSTRGFTCAVKFD